MHMSFESAFDWNRRHPPGTRVSLQFTDGRCIATTTRSWATQWGSFAVLQLDQVDGLWTTSVLVATQDLFDTNHGEHSYER